MDDETRGPGPEGPFDPFDVFDDDLDDEAFLEAWAEAERDAAEVVAEGLAGIAPVVPDGNEVAEAAASLRDAHRGGDPAAVWMLRSAGIRDPRAIADEDLLIRAVAATISMVEDPELPAEDAATIMSLELGDWVGAILGLVRAGPGSRADADVLVRHIETVEEVAGPPIDEDDRLAIEHAFLLVLPAWEVAGAVEVSYVAGTTLTRLGAWLLPTAAVHAWTLGGGLDLVPRPPLRLVDVTDDATDHTMGDGTDGWLEPYGEHDDMDADDPLAVAVRSILATDGPLVEDDLADRLVTEGVIALDEREDATDLLWDVRGLYPVRDRRWVHLPSLAEARTFTHRVTASELEDQRLASHPDLALYLTFLPPLPFAGGGEVVERYWRGDDPDREASLFGPAGWLPAGLAPGDLVACRIVDGQLTVTRLAEDDLDPEASDRAVEHLRATFDALGGRNTAGGPLDGPELLLETVVRYPAVFRHPTLPVADLLEAAGLADEDGAVSDPEQPWEPAPYTYFAEVYGLDEHSADALRILSASMDLFEREDRDDLPADTAANLLQMLTLEPAIAEALADTQLGIVGAGTDGLERLTRLLRPYARGRSHAPLELLVAKAAEARGDAMAGEAALRRAVQADPAYEPAHEDLAWYLEDRGDWAGALRHLRQAGIPNDDEQVQRLTELQSIRPAVGRNDPCPCGSGAKYKRCCERTGGPLPDRVSPLFDKMSNYLGRPLQRGALMALVEARAGDATDDRRLVAAIGDPLLFDVALFEGEWLEDFLEERGQLLPADERDLAASWTGLPRSLYEIVAVRPGEELELLDLRSGDRVVVRERAGSTQLRAGEAIFARVVPDGVGHQLAAGTLLIPVQQRDRLLAFLDTRPSAIEICSWIAASEAPPTLLTMEGEPTVFCTAEYRVADPDQARTVLTDRYEADPHGAMFVDWVDVDGRRWGRGTVELDGDRIVIQTNAEPRLDRFKAVIEELVAGAELLDESRRAASELFGGHGAANPDSPGSVGPSFDELPEEVRSALEAEIRRHEERWVDESIPMFGGLTPRQALDDPTRRPQLLAFLDELGDQETPGAMSSRRIRRLLGLGLL
jgi:hypothetical protein